MAFEWKDYFNLANYLLANANDTPSVEAAQRSAMSRAYYAAFCHARDVAIEKYGYVSRGIEDHDELRNFYKGRGMLKISTALDRLRQWRNTCDYDNPLSSSLSAMIIGIGNGKYVLKTLHLV